LQLEIDVDAAALNDKEKEFVRLQSEEGRIAKQQSWLTAIAGQPDGPAIGGLGDPSKLGARPDAKLASGGRKPFGGLGGPAVPDLKRRPLAQQGGGPMARQVQQPIEQGVAGMAAPKPVHRVVRQPLPAVASPVVAPQPMPQPSMSFDPKPDITHGNVLPTIPEFTPQQSVMPEAVVPVAPITPEITSDGKVAPARAPVSADRVLPTLPSMVEEPGTEVVTETLPMPIHGQVSAPESAVMNPISNTVLSPKPSGPKGGTASLRPVDTTIMSPVSSGPPGPSKASLTPVSRPVMSPSVKPQTASITPIAKVMAPIIPLEDRTDALQKIIGDKEDVEADLDDEDTMASMLDTMSVKIPTISGVSTDEEDDGEDEQTPVVKRGPPPSAGKRGPPPSAGKRGPPPSAGKRAPPSSGGRGPPSGVRRDQPEDE